ncbi:hypothetical protein COI83_14090 [Bacillus cereus]|nr:hypothetical protein COI83_14090 [Bacillus cereus]
MINGFLPKSVQGMQDTGPENLVRFLVIIMYANELKLLIEIKPNPYCSKKNRISPNANKKVIWHGR